MAVINLYSGVLSRGSYKLPDESFCERGVEVNRMEEIETRDRRSPKRSNIAVHLALGIRLSEIDFSECSASIVKKPNFKNAKNTYIFKCLVAISESVAHLRGNQAINFIAPDVQSLGPLKIRY